MTMLTGTLPQVSNQEDFTLTDTIYDDATGDLVNLSGASIVFEVRDPNYRRTVLSATTGNGKAAVVDTGVYQVAFSRSEMQALHPGTYDVGCVITLNGTTAQLLIGTVQVLDGVVTQ